MPLSVGALGVFYKQFTNTTNTAIRRRVVGAKIAVLDLNLQKSRMHLGVNVVIDDPDKLEDIRRREIEITTERIQKILNAGANVILTTKGIDDTCLKCFVEANAMAVRRCKKDDLKRIAKATGGVLIIFVFNIFSRANSHVHHIPGESRGRGNL